nr:MAG TPA: hypothetical protein [Caudoviricetes sp.]
MAKTRIGSVPVVKYTIVNKTTCPFVCRVDMA